MGIKTIAGLILIHLHLQKLSSKHQLRTSTLLSNHTIKSLFKSRHDINSHSHHLSLKNMTFKWQLKIKSFIVDTNNFLNGIFPLFNSLNSKFSPSFRLIDIFPSHFSVHKANCKDKESKIAYICKLNDIFTEALLNFKSVIVVSDTSIKNDCHIYHLYSFLFQFHQGDINFTITEAKLFAIRYVIN